MLLDDGLLWGSIGNDFSMQEVQQICHLILDNWIMGNSVKAVVVAFDTRYGSEQAAKVCSEVLTSYGLKVILAREPVPIGALYNAMRKEGAMGIMITGGERAVEYNGVRLLPLEGDELSNEEWTRWRKHLGDSKWALPAREVQTKGLVQSKSLLEEYLEYLLQTIQVEKIKEIQSGIVFDSLYGSAQGIIHSLFQNINHFQEIHSTRHSMFGGLVPSLEGQYLQELITVLHKHKATIGIAWDPEGRNWAYYRGSNGRLMNGSNVRLPIRNYWRETRHQEFEWFMEKDGVLCSLLFLEWLAN